MAQDYNSTLNLPKTEFSMRASLPQREPQMLADWLEERMYYKMIEKNRGKPSYILHDGPPYANGDIHMGTALNKSLKDIIVRSKNMLGYYSPFVPGWDTHGLPIELRALKAAHASHSDSDPITIRGFCKDYALKYVGIQGEQFRRLGCLGDYDAPYITLQPSMEARQVEIFGDMMEKGYIYKGLKPVYWCPECETALAEAEIEYADDPCHSLYVKFQLKDDGGKLTAMGAQLDRTYFIIWTTTTWTLPGNMAICLGPDFEYVLAEAVKDGKSEYYIVAKALLEDTMQVGGVEEYSVLGSLKGSDFEYLICHHPFLDRDSLVIVGDHVTLESGTGCVHTASGHGVEDFDICQKYNIPIIVPVDNHGRMTAEAGFSAGLKTDDANKVIAEHLSESGHLFAVKKLNHQYPHCWRCKQKVLFRATEQWFCSIDGFKEDTLKAIADTEWILAWGEERMRQMVADRSDWCISRQRVWGVPIPVFYCEQCGQVHANKASFAAVQALFAKEGSDAWFIRPASEILPAGTVCEKCGSTEFRKESDIMDVWFDSGSTHASVLEDREGQTWPADLYLEGSDQFRGWFQSSLLTAVAWRGRAPFKTVCSAGWVVDGEGRKMSKSLGNGILATDMVNENGADILRLWVASSDYHSDIRVSPEIIKQISEVYRKIRNTARYILGNLYDFNPDTDCLPDEQLPEIDRWALAKLNALLELSRKAYERFEFHVLYHAVHNFCTVDMSNFYLDVIKDRLYVEAPTSLKRRAAQTAIYKILRELTLIITPILAFTSDEIWRAMPHRSSDDAAHPVYNEIGMPHDSSRDAALLDKWESIHAVRDDVNKALEIVRGEKLIGKSLEAMVTLHCSPKLMELLEPMQADLKMIFIVSGVTLTAAGEPQFTGLVDGLGVTITPAQGGKCERCWEITPQVGTHSEHPTLCTRCATIIPQLG